jgi:hypothetical protein
MEGRISAKTLAMQLDQAPTNRRAVLAWLRGPDGVLVAAALLFGAMSLTYPFGHDQGLYYYVGREWLGHGALPYRDAVEQKTPGIYVIHGVLYLLFGERQWPIRVVDLSLVCVLGWLLAMALKPIRGERTPGLVGVCCFALSLMHYGFMLFWDTAQLEIVYVTLVVGSIVVIQRGRHAARTDVAAGLLVGAAILVKPPAVWFCIVALAVLSHRAWRDAERGKGARALAVRLLRFGAASLALPVITVVYFAANHALADLVLWTVSANAYYVAHASGPLGVGITYSRTRQMLDWFAPTWSIVAAYFALVFVQARTKRDAEMLSRCWLVLALAAAGYASVAMQLKFYRYHTDVFAGVIAGAVGCSYIAIAQNSKRAPAVLASWFAGALVVTYALSGRADIWFNSVGDAVSYWTGRTSRDQFNATFDIPGLLYEYGASERVGNWIREHSLPTDTIAVRGFQPEVYEVARRRYAGRFFWTNFIVDEQRSMKRDAWRAEDLAALAASPPLFVVTVSGSGDIDSPAFFEKRGYQKRLEDGFLGVYERPGVGAPPANAR